MSLQKQWVYNENKNNELSYQYIEMNMILVIYHLVNYKSWFH